MMLLMTVIFENGFQEIYLPVLNNKTAPIEIRPHISGFKEDIKLPLEVWDHVWTLSSSRQFVITINERQVEKVELSKGMLLNCQMIGYDIVFSLTVEEADEGNTQFEKYLLDFASCSYVKIGSGDGNTLYYSNQFSSPAHAEIIYQGGNAIVRDLNSVNGTFVNGRLLSEDRVLTYGDVIYVIGLKIVYLGNIIAVNNPKGSCRVDKNRLKPIHIEVIESNAREEGYHSEDSYFMRTPRRLEHLNHETFAIEKCPVKNNQKRQPILFTIGPAFTMMIPMIAGAMMMGGNGSMTGGLVMSIGAALLGAMWAILNIRYQKREEEETETKRVSQYTTYLSKTADLIQNKMEHNIRVLSHMLPFSSDVLSFAKNANSRLWEKSAVHEDFLTVCLGKGQIPSPNQIVVSKEQMLSEHDPLNDKVDEIKTAMSTLNYVPLGLSFHENRMIGLVSKDRMEVLNLSRIVGTQIVGLHPYTEVRMCYIYPMRESDSWNYLRFLPHAWTPDNKLRLVANDKKTVGEVMYYMSNVIRERLEAKSDGAKEESVKILPHYVVMIADWSLVEEEPIAKYLMNPSPELGLTVIYCVDAIDKLPSSCTTIIRNDQELKGYYSTTGAFEPCEHVSYEIISLKQMDEFARCLSNYHVRELGVSTAIPDMLTFLDMYKTSKVEELDMLHKWLENRTYESMRAMIGIKTGNQPLYLDIHEKYHGPHGLVAGTTGSGKSETLQSYILSLAINYHPHEVGFVLIDYKGGGMAQSFLGLPHLSGVITNLGGNATNRALLSIQAEIKRRQKVFNEFKVKHIDAYIELYRNGVASEPIPHLLIIADEFAELKKEQPEFVRALVSAARVGRSLGVNLILATQKPSGVVDDEIWSNTRFRLCLRVADKQDSIEMIKRPEAAFLTGTGRGYFQVGNDEIFEEFQSGWSGAEYEPEIPFSDDKNIKVELINLIGKPTVLHKKAKKSSNTNKKTQLDAIVTYAGNLMNEHNISANKQIWLPPLPKIIYLDELTLQEQSQGFSLRLPIGLADDPENQCQFPVVIDFIADGHLLVCGFGGSGRTTLLQTLIYSALQKYTPSQINIYIADFSSRTMSVFDTQPHVGGVMQEGDDSKMEEVFELLRKELEQRKRQFSMEGISSYREYVTQKDDVPAILFFIDNYVSFIESYELYEDNISLLSREAASYGIYLVLSMNNSGELRSRIRQNFTNQIALQMSDRFEYEAVMGEHIELMPESRISGRGLIKAPHPLEFQTALCLREKEGLSMVQTLRMHLKNNQRKEEKGVKKLGRAIEPISYDEFMARNEIKQLPQEVLSLGLTYEEEKPVMINLDEEFCFTISGLNKTGKTNLLALIAKQAKSKNSKLYLFDFEANVLEELGIFDAVVHNEVELFQIMEQEIVPEFSKRNVTVNDARDQGNSITNAMEQYQRIVFIINDMSAFMKAVYSPNMDMYEFFEIALGKGRQHKINFFAAITPDDYADMARHTAMRNWASWGRGVHMGGTFDQQTILKFEMSSADSVRQQPAGVGYALDATSNVVKFTVPFMALEDRIQEERMKMNE